jgi:hypothetical protein
MSALYALDYRCVVLDHGYFYTEDMYIIDENGYELSETRDYQVVGFNSEVTAVNGKTCCAVIVVTNPKVHSKIYVDAQMVGGPYEKVGTAIAASAIGLLNDTRKVHWNNIKGKPDDFAPGGHMHPLWELYGFTPSVVQFKRMSAALGKKAGKTLDAIYLDFDAKMKIIEGELAAVEARLTTHINDKQNPHVDTAAKIGLGNVLNAPTATETQARLTNGTIMNIYATPWSIGMALDANFTPILNAHVADHNNPHRNTAAQLSVYTVTQMNDKARLYVDQNATMEKTAAFFGQTAASLQPLVQQNNSTWNLTIGMYPMGLMNPYGPLPGYNPRDTVFKPDGRFQAINDVIARDVKRATKTFYIAGEFGDRDSAVNTANAWLVDLNAYPYGSLCFYHYARTRESYTGNGAVVYNTTRSTMILYQSGSSGRTTWTTNGGGA